MSEVLEGEVIGTARRRERNAVRTVGTDVLPPDVESKVVALRSLDGAGQAAAVTAMLSHSRTGLLAAIAAQDLPQIVEFKQKAAAIQEIAKQVRMGKEFQLDAAEFVRRAERGLGVAIREGQERGEVASKTNGLAAGPRSDYQRNGQTVHVDRDVQNTVKSPTDFASASELSGQHGAGGIYAMTDNVSDEQFEEAMAEARREANLSRANVARKARAKAETQPTPESKPPTALKKTAVARRTVEYTAVTLNNLAQGFDDITPEEVDAEHLQAEIDSIFQSIGIIRSFLKKVNKQ